MKKIIVPVDFSDCSLNAVRYACSLAITMKAQLLIVYVHTPELIVDTTPIWQPYVDIMPLPKMVHDQMKEVKQMVSEKGIQIQSFILEGLLNDSIIELAQSKHADLVVMGTPGIDYAYTSVFGSNTSHLIGSKKIPVLVVPQNYKGELTKEAQIVFATDFKGVDFIPDYFIELSASLNATINVFYDTEPYRDAVNKEYEAKEFEYVKTLFADSKVTLNHSFKENLIHAVEAFAVNKHASLIVMIAHKRGFLANLFHTSVTKQMAIHTHIPFLAIPDELVEVSGSVSNSGFIG